MNQHHNPTNSNLRRFGVATALGALLGAGVLFTLGGTASAEYEPVPPDLDNLEDLLVDDLEFNGPTLTIPVVPEDDDGPIYDGPIVSIPNGPDGPIFDGPIVTIPVVPGDTPPDDTTPPEQPPADQPPADQPGQITTPPA
jgi:hypothetical protein